jgi:hypothetical protein
MSTPWARVIKVSDFADNAIGLFHTTGASLPRRADKYRPLLPVLREFVLPLGASTCSEPESPRIVQDYGLISAIPPLSGAKWLLRAHTFAMGGFDRGFDHDNGSERDRPAEAEALGDSTVRGGEPRIAVETRTRGEAYADLRQIVESGWDRGRRYEAPHGELAMFRAERAGLPEVSSAEADRYVERHRAGRPWLQAAERASPEALRIIVAADQGGGHGHIRHEGWVTEEASMRRVAYLEDPAQLDPDKRRAGIDGLRSGSRNHICADISSRITDPDAFATALARGAGHPDVRAALSTPYDRRQLPRPVWVPIAELLGSDGHKACTGWQLEPAAGSVKTAMENRRAWRAAIADGRRPEAPEPRTRPVPTFEGGTIAFVISSNRQRDGYEIASLFPRPPVYDFPAR